jgi:hypothetical protein
MIVTAFAHQVLPGSDTLLHFEETYEACRRAAISQRYDLLMDEDYPHDIGPMVIYECRLELPNCATLLAVLNSPDDPKVLFNACIVDKQIIGIVTD